MIRSVLRTLFFAAVCVTPVGKALAEPPKVVATIPPLHSLAAAVMEGVGEPHLLLKGTASPHTYAWKPSDVAAVHDADLLVFVGPNLETFLARTLETLGNEVARIEAITLGGLTLHPYRKGGVWADDEPSHNDDHGHHHGQKDTAHHHGQKDTTHHHGHEHGHAGEHGDAAMDGHLWLDPQNATVIAKAIAQKLTAIDPENAATYQRNTEALTMRINALSKTIEATLSEVLAQRYLVFHDAYQYFEKRYALSPIGAISIRPDRPLAAKRLRTIQNRVQETGAVCIFAEPQFDSLAVKQLAKDVGIRLAQLDPVGATLTPGPGLYPKLLENMSRSLADCLSGSTG